LNYFFLFLAGLQRNQEIDFILFG